MFSREELRINGRLPAAFWVGVSLKLGLVLLLMLPLFQPGLEQYEGKGMSWRILVFPLAGLIVPVLWYLTGARAPYPYFADNLLVLPPLTDVLWNTLDAYERIWWWDDANHLVNAMVFAAVIGLWAGRYALGPVVRFGLALGLSMTLQVLWEIGEYWVLIADLSSSVQGYEDTVGDLAFGLFGAASGAAFALLAVGSAEQVGEEAEPARAFATRD
ncbi:MAG TPA: hypothetical protein VK926_01830 [Gaiellaceae bacterium]|nr:hypothetical protein [Gaiellaceae bacterium]